MCAHLCAYIQHHCQHDASRGGGSNTRKPTQTAMRMKQNSKHSQHSGAPASSPSFFELLPTQLSTGLPWTKAPAAFGAAFRQHSEAHGVGRSASASVGPLPVIAPHGHQSQQQCKAPIPWPSPSNALAASTGSLNATMIALWTMG